MLETGKIEIAPLFTIYNKCLDTILLPIPVIFNRDYKKLFVSGLLSLGMLGQNH